VILLVARLPNGIFYQFFCTHFKLRSYIYFVITEIIEHGKNGFLAANQQDWMNYLSELIENPHLRIKMGIAGRETVVKNYSVNANKVKYLEVLKSLIK
jgi:glycosyltransferase involved in cell wall biosynthesis